jgi:hypothetical protein
MGQGEERGQVEAVELVILTGAMLFGGGYASFPWGDGGARPLALPWSPWAMPPSRRRGSPARTGQQIEYLTLVPPRSILRREDWARPNRKR